MPGLNFTTGSSHCIAISLLIPTRRWLVGTMIGKLDATKTQVLLARTTELSKNDVNDSPACTHSKQVSKQKISVEQDSVRKPIERERQLRYRLAPVVLYILFVALIARMQDLRRSDIFVMFAGAKKQRKKPFQHVQVGNQNYAKTPSCQDLLNDPDEKQKCRIYFPLVDLDEEKLKYDTLPEQYHVDMNLYNTAALLTQRGIGPSHEHGNQDRALILAPFYPIHSSKIIRNPKNFLMCIMDGHGNDGHAISEYTASTLPSSIAQHIQHAFDNDENTIIQTVDVVTAIQRAFLEVNDQVCRNQQHLLSGTTATVALRLDNHLYVASAGDTLMVVVAYSKSKQKAEIIHKSQRDTPNLEGEQERIQKQGGIIITANPQSSTKRVVIPYQTQDKSEKMNLSLAVSRSIGDGLAKRFGVIAEPTVTAIPLHDYSTKKKDGDDDDIEFFCIAATDGLLDKISPEQLVDSLISSILGFDSVSSIDSTSAVQNYFSMLQTMEQLIYLASNAWKPNRIVANNALVPYRDDITIAVKKFKV